MLAAGWLDECRGLRELEKEHPLSKEARQAIGYRQLFAYLDGALTLDEARERIKFETHHFARRQLSWFRRFNEVTWIEIGETETVASIADRVEAALSPRA
jgi:tRNA dimethylallyltransferase